MFLNIILQTFKLRSWMPHSWISLEFGLKQLATLNYINLVNHLCNRENAPSSSLKGLIREDLEGNVSISVDSQKLSWN